MSYEEIQFSSVELYRSAADQVRGPSAKTGTRRPWGTIVQTIRPNTTEPIPVRATPPKMGTIIIRFSGLLVVAVALMAWAWSR